MAALGYTAKPSQSVGPLCTAGTTATALTHTCSGKQGLATGKSSCNTFSNDFWYHGSLSPYNEEVDSFTVHGIWMADEFAAHVTEHEGM